MRTLFACLSVSLMAFIKPLFATPVLISQSQLGKPHFFDPLALGHSSDQDGRNGPSILKSCYLRARDLDQALTKDLMSLSKETSTSANIHNHVSHSKAKNSLSVSERSLLIDLTTTGFRLIWDYMDITYASYIAFYQTTESWANITADARGKWKAKKKVMTLDISYGSLKLSIAGLIDAISWELVAEFAAEMLVLSRIVIFGTSKLILLAIGAALVITLAIAGQVLGSIKSQQLVTGP